MTEPLFEDIAKHIRKYDTELEKEDAVLKEKIECEIKDIRLSVGKIKQILSGKPFCMNGHDAKKTIFKMEKANYLKRLQGKEVVVFSSDAQRARQLSQLSQKLKTL